MTLSPSQTQILIAAAQHEQHLAKSPPGLPAGARNAVFRSMLRNGLLAEVAAPPEYVGLAWRQDEHGTPMVARIIGGELRAIGLGSTKAEELAGAPCTPSGVPTPDAATDACRAGC